MCLVYVYLRINHGDLKVHLIRKTRIHGFIALKIIIKIPGNLGRNCEAAQGYRLGGVDRCDIGGYSNWCRLLHLRIGLDLIESRLHLGVSLLGHHLGLGFFDMGPGHINLIVFGVE